MTGTISQQDLLAALDLLEEVDARNIAWGLTDEDLAEIARRSVQASFADAATKAEIEREIDAWLAPAARVPPTGYAEPPVPR